MGNQLRERDIMRQIAKMLAEENLISSREQLTFLSVLKEVD